MKEYDPTILLLTAISIIITVLNIYITFFKN